jgi:dipeptidyl aminopeptidase/acylaminoacyl peptidase
VDTGHLIYNAGGTLRAVRFDLAKLEVLGDPAPVLEQVMTGGSGAANFSVSGHGTLVYVPAGAGSQTSGVSSLVWVTRQGREERIAAPLRNYVYPSLSPDGSRAALAIDDEERDIWSWDFTRQTLTRLTFDPGREWYPGWMPDGRRIVFVSARGSVFNLYRRFADGTGSDERLTTSPHVQYGTPAFPPDGTRVVFTEVTPETGEDLMMLSLDATRRTEPLLQAVRREECADLPRRPLARVRVERIGPGGNLRATVSQRARRTLADFYRWRQRSTLGTERPGTVLPKWRQPDVGSCADDPDVLRCKSDEAVRRLSFGARPDVRRIS